MKIFTENINVNSDSGPNSFAKKLIPQLQNNGCEFTDMVTADISLCFIESRIREKLKIPRVLRLDGIYFNTAQDYQTQNQNIKRTFDLSDGVIYQSEFNKNLIESYFGPHKSSVVIHNGADLNFIESITPMLPKKNGSIWCCASQWRPHKRLRENIRYFLEHKKEDDVLIIAGSVEEKEKIKDKSVAYFGNLTPAQLCSVYKTSKYFIHLAWLDHCPNVVVDARASGCHIICTDAGGTKEIAGLDSTIIEEDSWDFKPLNLYSPPTLDFQRKIKNSFDSYYDMEKVSKTYKNFLEQICQRSKFVRTQIND
jgi:glycosyltransferase involved in cell wall biosynthesis